MHVPQLALSHATSRRQITSPKGPFSSPGRHPIFLVDADSTRGKAGTASPRMGWRYKCSRSRKAGWWTWAGWHPAMIDMLHPAICLQCQCRIVLYLAEVMLQHIPVASFRHVILSLFFHFRLFPAKLNAKFWPNNTTTRRRLLCKRREKEKRSHLGYEW